ncbi:AMP-binding protein [Streptomyces sp. NPDC055287]
MVRVATTITVTPAEAVTPTAVPAAPKRPRKPAGGPETLDGLFSRAVARRPGAVVVADGRRTLSYEAAEKRSGLLASALLRSGVQLGDPVLVHCTDHAQALVAHLAVLKLGAVCVPVPCGVDDDALRRIVVISGAALVLCSGATRERWTLPAMVLDDARTWARIGPMRVDGSLPRSGLTDAAYLLVEQGDGDGPTGHLVDHRALFLAVSDRIRRAGRPERGVAVGRQPGEARSLAALWWAVGTAGRLYGPPPEAAVSEAGGLPEAGSVAVFGPREYAAVLAATRAAATDGGRVATRLGTVLLTGEPCPAELAEQHFDTLPFTRLLSEFSPRDGLMPWTAIEYTSGAQAPSPLVVGETVSRVRVTIRDAEGHALPSGSPGHIWAAGAALPFDRLRAHSRVPASRSRGSLADSGYMGRWNSDGVLEVTGRAVRPVRMRERMPAGIDSGPTRSGEHPYG